MDVHADFASRCAIELQSAGYTPSPGSSDEIIMAYANVQHRRVPQRPRIVHKPAAYPIPADLVAGEQAFIAKVAAGDDLRPHQSTNLERADFNDGLLNDFGLQHFHLGIGPHPTKPGFMARTEPVLFALVRDDDFYSLGCYPHGAWSMTSLLDLIHSTWPDVIAPYTAKLVQGLGQTHTDAEIALLRKAGILTLTQRPDGTVHLPPGGGVTSSRQSGKVARDAARIKRHCGEIEAEIKRALLPELASGELSPPVSVRLEQRGVRTFAILDNGRGEIDLYGCLSVPPL
jgi:hypothetical protein